MKKINLPSDVKFIINTLNAYDYEAYAVGGCVRDSLLGLIPHDWDICTSALPEQIKRCFANCKMFDAGIKHGTISLVLNGEIYEITTFRIDGEYLDCRHPQSVSFTDDIAKDLSRRDFTVNAMAYNEEMGLVDPLGGTKDLENKLIHCVRNADERFNEDALRILRALRFAAVYGFEIDKDTSKAIIKNAALLKNIAAERITVELNKLLCAESAARICTDYKEVLAEIIPELRSMFDYVMCTADCSINLWKYTACALSLAPEIPEVRMAVLLHHIGKPLCKTTDSSGKVSYIGCAEKSAEISEKILRRLKYSNEFISLCTSLIKYCGFNYCGSKSQICRLLNSLGENNTRLLFEVILADITAQPDSKQAEKLEDLNRAKTDLDEIIAKNQCYSLKQLAINGRDLKSLGIGEGKIIGELLGMLLGLVCQDEIQNNREDLLQKAAELYKYNKIKNN